MSPRASTTGSRRSPALGATANAARSANSAVYNMAVSSFDVTLHPIAASNIQIQEIYASDQPTQGNFVRQNSFACVDLILSQFSGSMPNPGNGANASGDPPRELPFPITDGVDDDPQNGVSVRKTSACDAIKARGIKIGVVYATHFAAPGFFAYFMHNPRLTN